MLLYCIAVLTGRTDMHRRHNPTSFSKAIPEGGQSASIRDQPVQPSVILDSNESADKSVSQQILTKSRKINGQSGRGNSWAFASIQRAKSKPLHKVSRGSRTRSGSCGEAAKVDSNDDSVKSTDLRHEIPWSRADSSTPGKPLQGRSRDRPSIESGRGSQHGLFRKTGCLAAPKNSFADVLGQIDFT
jgi:hypothetical protein